MFTLDPKNSVVLTTELDSDGDISIKFDSETVAFIDQESGSLELLYLDHEDRAPLAAKGVAFDDSGYWKVNA